MVRTEAEAREQIRRFVAAGEEPALSEDEIESLVVQSRREDGAWDINEAVACGWQLKCRRAEPGLVSSHCWRQYVRWRLRTGPLDPENQPAARPGKKARSGRRR